MGFFRKQLLENDCFTLLCNDCSAGRVYEALGISAKKKSPTVNVIISDSDFIKLCENPTKYLSKRIKPLPAKERSCLPFGYRADKNSEIGQIEDIKIMFRHNFDGADVYDRWNNALQNVDCDNLIFLYSDGQRAASYELFERFSKIRTKKLLMVCQGFCRMNGLSDSDYLIWDTNYFFRPDIPIEIHFDLLGWLNGINKEKG